MRALAFLTLLGLLIFTSCSDPKEPQKIADPVKVELQTSMGSIIVELSDKTPLHRDNFIAIAEKGWLDSMIFHRVLSGFVVQGGEYDSAKYASMDSTILEQMDYRVPAEFDTSLFHVRGAIAAARTGNPDRESASLQFYFVHAGPRPDSLMVRYEERINQWLRENAFVNAPENKAIRDSLIAAEEAEDYQLFGEISQRANALAVDHEFESYSIPEAHKEVYRTVGGTPFLDQNYTVFGKVLTGMAAVDSIAEVAVNPAGRPFENVYILSAEVRRDSTEVQ